MTVEELIIILESFNPDTPVYVAIQKEQLYIYDPIVEVGQAQDEGGHQCLRATPINVQPAMNIFTATMLLKYIAQDSTV